MAQGLPASPGAASGQCVFDADRAEMLGRSGHKVILVREETKPEDIHGFFASQGILTSRGGKTSHAAVVARGMGKPCVAGAEGIHVDVKLRQANIGEKILHEGDFITIDGGTGYVYQGVIPTVEPTFSDELKRLLQWADEAAKLKVMANADTPESAAKGFELWGDGYWALPHGKNVQCPGTFTNCSRNDPCQYRRRKIAALNQLLPIQKQDFKDILTTMAPRPVTVRLLDPPIHEFLPTEDELREELIHLRHLKDTASGVNNLFSSLRLLHAYDENAITALPFNEKGVELIDQAIVKKEQMLKKVHDLYEVNPMLGHRGVRLGLTYPEIYKMQIQAILEAAADCQQAGIDVRPEIMVPQVCNAEELRQVKAYVEEIRQKIEHDRGIRLVFKFGTMIEVVRACVTADELAKEAEFFSFGTNDLTQATFSFSREDAENKFLPLYAEKNILHDNPFEIFDKNGVGKLMQICCRMGPQNKSGIENWDLW